MASNTCRNCNTLLNPNQSYCEQCGENNPHFVKPTYENNESTSSTKQTSFTSSNSYSAYPPPQEGTAVGWFFLALFFPIIGFILAFGFKNDKPKAYSASLTGSILRLIITFIAVL